MTKNTSKMKVPATFSFTGFQLSGSSEGRYFIPDRDISARPHMNENTYYRRSLIKRGLTLIGSIFFLGAFRSNFGATQTPEPSKKSKRFSRRPGTTRHCIEAVSLGLPVQYPEINKD
jgi:hypothetical protein